MSPCQLALQKVKFFNRIELGLLTNWTPQWATEFGRFCHGKSRNLLTAPWNLAKFSAENCGPYTSLYQSSTPGSRAWCYAECTISSLVVAVIIDSNHFAYLQRNGQAELTWAAWLNTRTTQPQKFTHLSTNVGQCRVWVINDATTKLSCQSKTNDQLDADLGLSPRPRSHLSETNFIHWLANCSSLGASWTRSSPDTRRVTSRWYCSRTTSTPAYLPQPMKKVMISCLSVGLSVCLASKTSCQNSSKN